MIKTKTAIILLAVGLLTYAVFAVTGFNTEAAADPRSLDTDKDRPVTAFEIDEIGGIKRLVDLEANNVCYSYGQDTECLPLLAYDPQGELVQQEFANLRTADASRLIDRQTGYTCYRMGSLSCLPIPAP